MGKFIRSQRATAFLFLLLFLELVYLINGILGVANTGEAMLIREEAIADGWSSQWIDETTIVFSTPLSLTEGTHFAVRVTGAVKQQDKVQLDVILADKVVLGGFSREIKTDAAIDSSGEAAFYRSVHQDAGNLLVCLRGEHLLPDSLRFHVDRMQYRYGLSTPLWIALTVTCVLALAVLTALVVTLVKKLPSLKKLGEVSFDGKKVLAEYWDYLLLPVLVTAVLLVIYRNAELFEPLLLKRPLGDEKEHFLYTDLLIRYGWKLQSPYAGGVSGFVAYDYPFANSLIFLLVKLLGNLSSNPYFVCNLFYFSCYHLCALTANYACRSLGFRKATGILVSCLFAFSPFIQQRYQHLFLCAYFMIPLCCLLAVRIVKGYYEEHPERIASGLALALLCATTGLYYAFFSGILLGGAVVIAILEKEEKKLSASWKFCFPLSVLFGIILQLVPNFLYWMRVGGAGGEFSSRYFSDAERYAAKMTQMILPRADHRIPLFRAINEAYNSGYHYVAEHFKDVWVETMFVNENADCSLGLLASIGFLISLVWLLRRKKAEKAELASLNLWIFLFGTVGGFGSMLAFAGFSQLRGYCRLVLFLMFFSLLVLATVLEKLVRKGMALGICCAVLLLVGVFDQTVDYKRNDLASQYEVFNASRDMYRRIESALPANSAVYTLPYINWPESGNTNVLLAPVETAHTRWSIGCMQGRGEADWQKLISVQAVPDMVEALRAAGYAGIFLDSDIWYLASVDSLQSGEMIEQITAYLGQEPEVSASGLQYFWRL
ncbi:MAG: hypothetical protein K6E50_11675 [Lachnospiraceae bacterium]|nr:hypothetical protein [Lachnospiraceae bacterium]